MIPLVLVCYQPNEMGLLTQQRYRAPVSRTQTSNEVGKNLVGVVSRKFAQQTQQIVASGPDASSTKVRMI